MGLVWPGMAMLAVTQREALQAFTADQAVRTADWILFVEQIPGDVVKHQLQGPDPQLPLGTVGKGGSAGRALQHHPLALQDRGLDATRLARSRQRIGPHPAGMNHRVVGIGAHRATARHGDASLLEAQFQVGEQLLGGRIAEPASRLLQHPVNGLQFTATEQGGAEGIAVAHVVIAHPETIGGEDLLGILAQAGGFVRQIGTRDGAALFNQVALQIAPTRRITIEWLLQQVPQQREQADEHRPISERWDAAMHPTRRRNPGPPQGQGRWLERRGHRQGAAEPLVIQPGQIGTDGRDIAVARAVQMPQEGRGTISQVARRQRREQGFQFGAGGGIIAAELGIRREQLEQIKEPLEIQQARVAVERKAFLTIQGRADALIETGQFLAQKRCD